MAGERGPLRRTLSSLRFRVTAVATAATLVVLVAVGIGVVVLQQHLLVEDLDDALGNRADELAAIVASGDIPATVRSGGDGDDTGAQVVDAAGAVVASSANVAGLPPFAPPPDDGRTEQLRTVDDVPLGDGPVRVLTRRVDGPGGASTIHVAASLEDVHDSRDALVGSLAVALPAATLVLALLTWWLVGRTLRPVEAIRREVAGIDGGELTRRVPEPGSGDEIDRLAVTMNAMLERVEDAIRREQRFVADASHELRQPLTRIRSEIDVDTAHPAGADLAATHRSVVEEVVGMQHLVEDLLALARSDAGVATVRARVVDLDDIVLAEVGRLRADGRVAVDIAGVTAAQVRGDEGQLTRLVANLVDNAARHAASTVRLTLAEEGERAVLTVADDGPGIPPAERDRVFDRFARLDDARTASVGGTGLGLAIARDIARRHGGTIGIDAPPGAGARFVVMLPRRDGATPA